MKRGYIKLRWLLLSVMRCVFKVLHKSYFKYPDKYIPKDTPYCYSSNKNCPFWKNIPWLPNQQNGYCYYLNKADIEMNPERNKESKICYSKNKEDEGKSVSEILGEYFPTSLLWDQCKECGINEDYDT
ncbi:MAG: hypothetical protein PHF63_14105 [Herbinix sp.]|nr:hypothetical protein [Herbinix sp.]